jgi:zinc and cadmium transporter
MAEALIASIFIALLSTVGALVFGEHHRLRGAHRFILPVAVGVFLGVAFFELVPETLAGSEKSGPIAILIGFLGFYLLSHILDTYHHHHGDNHDSCSQNGAKKLLIGDAIHNLADGIVIASAFMINPITGLLTTVGIALHEIPQEIAEFGVLRAANYTVRKAILLNLLSASTVILGVLLTYLLREELGGYTYILTGIAAGNLLYIATADLIPELRHSHRDHFTQSFIATLLSATFIGTLITLGHTL